MTDRAVSENDEDRKKMVTAVGVLLEKADVVYNQLNAHKPQLEALLLQVPLFTTVPLSFVIPEPIEIIGVFVDSWGFKTTFTGSLVAVATFSFVLILKV